MSLEAQITRLNDNLEALVGAITAQNSLVMQLAANPQAVDTGKPTEKPAAAEPARSPGRPRKRYYRLPDGSKVHESETKAGDGWTEITKAEFEAVEKPEADSDPFGDEPAAVPTEDDVRQAAFKYRDARSKDDAVKLIGQFVPAGAEAKIANIPEDTRAAFIAAIDKELKGAGDL